PLPDILEKRALRQMPGVHRRRALRIEQIVDIPPRKGTEGDRGVRRAESRYPYLGKRLSKVFGNDPDGGDIGGLPLVRGHPGRRVALDVLDRAIAFAQRQEQVGGRNIMLLIDEMLA